LELASSVTVVSLKTCVDTYCEFVSFFVKELNSVYCKDDLSTINIPDKVKVLLYPEYEMECVALLYGAQ
jgi:hypothetical protein